MNELYELMMFAPSITPMEQHKLGRLHHPLVLLSIGALARGSLNGGVDHAQSSTQALRVDEVYLAPGQDGAYTVRKDIPGDILNYHHEGVKRKFHTLPLFNIPLTIIKTHQRLDPFPT